MEVAEEHVCEVGDGLGMTPFVQSLVALSEVSAYMHHICVREAYGDVRCTPRVKFTECRTFEVTEATVREIVPA